MDVFLSSCGFVLYSMSSFLNSSPLPSFCLSVSFCSFAWLLFITGYCLLLVIVYYWLLFITGHPCSSSFLIWYYEFLRIILNCYALVFLILYCYSFFLILSS